jgi:hypothetical protein
LLGNASQRGRNFLLLLRRRLTDIQHVYLDLRLRGGLLGSGTTSKANADQNYEDVSEHDGILNEDRWKS